MANRFELAVYKQAAYVHSEYAWLRYVCVCEKKIKNASYTINLYIRMISVCFFPTARIRPYLGVKATRYTGLTFSGWVKGSGQSAMKM